MLKKILAVAILLCGISFSVAQAKIETFEGTGAYPITNDKTHGEVKELAKNEAIRDALDKAGVAIYSEVQVEKNIVTKDVIKKTSGSILKILSDKYNLLQVDDDGIGLYKATVVISIDTDELNLKLQEFLKLESNTQATLARQYEELQRLNDANTKRIAELERQLSNKNSAKNSQQIKTEIAEIDKNTLYAQKISEGWKAWNNKNFEKALQLFDDAVNLNPNDYRGYFGRGTAYFDLKNYTQAIVDLNQAIKLNPSLAATYYNRGLAYKNSQNYQQAIRDFSKAIELDPNYSWAYITRGNSYYSLKNYTQAIQDYNKSIQLNPSYELAYNNRGNVYYLQKNYTQAIEDYTQAIKLNPDYTNAYYWRGKCYEALGDNAKAQSDFEKAKQLGYNG